jgi:sn-glycerol 3-phosphate transport system ATP-binding protein/multiple sugar transport system ATP-binding protein
VASLIGTPPISILPAEVTGGALKVADAAPLPLPADLAAKFPAGRIRLGVRPEAWFVKPEAGAGLTMPVSRIERLFTERAAFAHGEVAGSPVNALVPLDFPEVKQVSLEPDFERAYFFAIDSEAVLHTPGVPALF